MKLTSPALVLAASALAACANATPDASGTPDSGQLATQPVVPLDCVPAARMPVEGRASPYDSATITVGSQVAKICYGRPSANGRTIFGVLVPFDSLWRAGANEPTTLHLPFTADIAGLQVPPGSYSLYTIPSQSGEWTLIVNRSTSQWGHPSSYTPDVQAQELGRAPIRTERLDQHVEMFTIRSEPRGADRADILLEWERTRTRIPIRLLTPGG